MLPQLQDLASGSFVPSSPSIGGCPTRARVAISLCVSSSGGGLFKRPVILWIRGAFYLWRSAKIHKFPIPGDYGLRTLLVDKDYLPGSSENSSTSSLFPDDKLR
jgi:hypothetical protein